jgi:hypothetical protein
MKQFKFLIGFVLVIFTLCVSFGHLFIPAPKGVDSDSYSAERASKYIKVISEKPHSVEHPVERAKVRKYLYDKLVEMGGQPEIHEFDSIEFRYGGYFDIGNVYCQFDPVSGPAKSYVMLVAHFDSRFRQSERLKTVYSCGAGDDGYGVGAILELLSQSLKYRDEWKQGVKILFTDSEENELDGMKCAYNHCRDLFNNVGFIVNLESRGLDGPALLFETSAANDKVMDLYSEAKRPCGYSLTTVVYRFLPNFTDFTVVKEDVPGINFSSIDDINAYHVDDDNFDNINLSTIQHYGAQIEPILKEYLTSVEYAHPDALKGAGDKVFFTVPLLGLFSFTEPQFTLFCSIVFALFCMALVLNVSARNASLGGIFKKALALLLWSLVVLGVGEGIAYLSAMAADVPFRITDTRFVSFSPIVTNGSFIALIIIYLAIYFKRKKKSKVFNVETLLAASLLLTVFSVVLYFVIGENFFFAVPLMLTSVALIFNIFVFLNFLSLPALLLIALLGGSFLYALSVALTVGALGLVMFIAFFYIVLVVGLFECYMNQKRL